MRARAGLIVCCWLGACATEPQYLGEGKLYQLALTNDTAPALQTEDGALFIVETHAWLPVRTPSAAERAALNVSGDAAKPFPRLPWVARDDIPMQVDFTLTNLDNVKHNIDVLLNGANEFHEYFPRVIVDEQQAIPLHSQWEKRYDLGPKQRISETVREEELDEMAVDLATVVNGAPNSDEIVYFENNSATDKRAQPYIPKVIPGIVGVRLGLLATEQSNVFLEASVRVRDEADKLVSDGAQPMQLNPQRFDSVVPEN